MIKSTSENPDSKSAKGLLSSTKHYLKSRIFNLCRSVTGQIQIRSVQVDASLFAFKVLVIDETANDLVAPLTKLGDLREHNIALHLNVAEKREPIRDVTCIYLLAPSERNVRHIVEDA